MDVHAPEKGSRSEIGANKSGIVNPMDITLGGGESGNLKEWEMFKRQHMGEGKNVEELTVEFNRIKDEQKNK